MGAIGGRCCGLLIFIVTLSALCFFDRIEVFTSKHAEEFTGEESKHHALLLPRSLLTAEEVKYAHHQHHNSSTKPQQAQHGRRYFAKTSKHPLRTHRVLDNEATPSTTSRETITKLAEGFKNAESNGQPRSSVVEELAALDFTNECWYVQCGKNHTPLQTAMLESIGGHLLSRGAPIEEYIYNPHSASFWGMMDVWFIFDRTYSEAKEMTDQFNMWKNEVAEFHVNILVESDEILDKIAIPEWLVDYDMYSVAAAIKSMEGIRMPKYNLKKDDTIFVSQHSTIQFTQYLGLRNFANWISDREYIFIIDSYTGVPAKEIGSGNVIVQHIANLKTPSVIKYFSSISDPYKPGNDFTRGFPYELRNGVPTVLSHGRYVGTNDYDPLTKQLKGKEQTEPANDLVTTIPYKHLFSMSPVNMAFNRFEIGPALMYHTPEPSTLDAQRLAFSKYSDIFAGWVMKTCMDECLLGGKHGAPYVQQRSTINAARSSTIAEDAHNALKASDILNDPMLNDTTARRVFDAFNTFYMNETTAWKNPQCMGRIGCRIECIHSELAKFIRVRLADDFPFFDDYTHSMMIWANIWHNRHSVLGNMVPLAHASSKGPNSPQEKARRQKAKAEGSQKEEEDVGKCAAITITHNEKEMLPIWIKYHMQHFEPQDIYVLDHLTTDGSTAPHLLPKGINLRKMEGSAFLMPVAFRSKVIQLYQDRLLRMGYKCVLFSDTDEFIVPDPRKYPGGLKEYLPKFIANKDIQYTRVVAYELAHISYGNGTEESQEPEIDWTKALLQQRKYYVHDRNYNKPLLSKVRLAYRPGFHKLYDFEMNMHAPTDEDLTMFHIRSLDVKFCMEKENMKFDMTRQMETAELNRGYANHWNRLGNDKQKAEICKFAIGCFQGPLNNVTTRYDNTGVIPLVRIPDYFENVGL